MTRRERRAERREKYAEEIGDIGDELSGREGSAALTAIALKAVKAFPRHCQYVNASPKHMRDSVKSSLSSWQLKKSPTEEDGTYYEKLTTLR